MRPRRSFLSISKAINPISTGPLEDPVSTGGSHIDPPF